jgi:hypothetical protein
MIIEQFPSRESLPPICIVGSGPVGMALALELERLGRDVLVIEAGDMRMDDRIAEASRAVIVDPKRHAEMSLAVCRVFGGTSWTWGGRCVPYDQIDFADRDFVSDASWPIEHDSIAPWYKEAAKYLLCGSDCFTIPHKSSNSEVSLDFVERWATTPRLMTVHREALIQSKRIQISLRSTVVGLRLSANQKSVEALDVATPAGLQTVQARHFIIAAGGVETTRLLLWFQRKYPSHFGGRHDGPLGRYYMGHLSGKVATIQFEAPNLIKDLDFFRDGSGAFCRRRFLLTPEAQIKNKLLNTAFWPDNPPFYEPGHHSFILSATFLALAFPPSGRRILPEAIRLAHTGPRPYRLSPHLRNVALGAPSGALEMVGVLRNRFLTKPKKPGFLVSNRGGRYALHYHAEQVPTPESRITLSSEKDAIGVPRASIDLRFTDQDIESVLDSHEVLDRALRTSRIGHLVYNDRREAVRDQVWETAADGYHQIGGVRMGNNPHSSVVDADLRVHGLPNLAIASSAVFPSSGQANSTLLAVAFAMRLAHRLANFD